MLKLGIKGKVSRCNGVSWNIQNEKLVFWKMSESFLVFLVMSNLTDLNAASLIFPDRFGLLLQGFLKFNYEYDSAINVITIKVLKYSHQ